MPTRYYTLDPDHQPVECTSAEWLAWVESGVRRSMATRIGTERIETWFAGYRHFDEHLFRTLVYGMRCAGLTERYETYDDAMAGHQAMVTRVRAELAASPE